MGLHNQCHSSATYFVGELHGQRQRRPRDERCDGLAVIQVALVRLRLLLKVGEDDNLWDRELELGRHVRASRDEEP